VDQADEFARAMGSSEPSVSRSAPPMKAFSPSPYDDRSEICSFFYRKKKLGKLQ
jgi:hypothetical protein